MLDTTYCGHEDCDMEPCIGPVVNRDAIRGGGPNYDLVADASDLGLAPGDWPLVIRVPDRFGALLTFDRLVINRDREGDLISVVYARADRNRIFRIVVWND